MTTQRNFIVTSKNGMSPWKSDISTLTEARKEATKAKRQGLDGSIYEICPEGYRWVDHQEDRGPRHHTLAACNCGHKFVNVGGN